MAAKGSTLWGCFHTPQNRELFMLTAGDGSLHLCKYVYPDKRSPPNPVSKQAAAAGHLPLLASPGSSQLPATHPATMTVCSTSSHADVSALCMQGSGGQRQAALWRGRLRGAPGQGRAVLAAHLHL